MFYKKIISPIMFMKDPEEIHDLMLKVMNLPGAPLIASLLCNPRQDDPVDCFGLTFPNRVGLAAGFDKNAVASDFLFSLGFGHIEFGSITREPQPGNTKPRIFRIREDKALINRMGFPSEGIEKVAPRIRQIVEKSSKGIVGVNIGKSKSAPLDEALADYLYSFNKIKDFAHYVAINVSSPNTPELRKLQEKPRLLALLKGLQGANDKNIPILVKVAPDLTEAEVGEIVEVALESNIKGLIATNTTITRDGLSRKIEEAGGLSGKPLKEKSLKFVQNLSKLTEGKLPIIGVGGISTRDDVTSMLDAGATLIQVYTSFIYEGPGIVKKLLPVNS